MFGIDDAINGGVSLLGGWLQSRAAKKAAEEQRKAGEAAAQGLTTQAQLGATNIANAGGDAANLYLDAGRDASIGVQNAGAEGQQLLTDATNRFNPYSSAGTDALSRLQSGIAPGGEFSAQFEFDPATAMNEKGLQYQQKQAQSALINSGLAGGLIGGNTARALDEQTQAITSTYLNDAYNRAKGAFQMNRDNSLNPLKDLIGVGERANSSILQGSNLNANLGSNTANQLGEIGMDAARTAGTFRTNSTNAAEGMKFGAAQQAADLRTGAAAAGAAGTIGSGNAWADALGNISRSVDFGNLGRRRVTTRPSAPARIGNVDAPEVWA